MGRVKGICYGNDAFPAPYNPSIANSTLVFFGSDNTADYIGALFRKDYSNSVQLWCQNEGPVAAAMSVGQRYDVQHGRGGCQAL